MNYKCLDCNKYGVCKWHDKLKPFTEDVKTPVGVEIEIITCEEFDEARMAGD